MAKRFFAVFLLVGTFIAVGASKSEASFIASICNDAACSGGDDYVVTDTDNDGSIVILNTTLWGGITLSLNSAVSNSLLGSTTDPQMDMAYQAIGTGSIYFYATDTDFLGTSTFTGTIGGTQSRGGTVDFGLFGGNSNTESDLSKGVTSALIPCATGLACNYGTSLFLGANTVSPYSLTLMAHAVVNGAVSGNYQLTSTPVPEPASMLLIGAGLIGLGAVARRRFRAN